MSDALEMIAIVGGTVIDGNGGPLMEDGVILVEGTRIIAIGDRSMPIPQHAKQIMATGKFIMPGLMDTYVYLMDGAVTNVLIRYEGRYDELAIEAAQIALKNGVTTVFDGWGTRDGLIKARDAINQGRCIGSRIHLCGNKIASMDRILPTSGGGTGEAVYASFATRIDAG